MSAETAQSTSDQPAFDEIRVGMTKVSAEVELGPAGATSRLAEFLPLLASIRPCRDVELVELTWEQPSGAVTGATAHLVATVTRRGPGGEPDTAQVVQDLRLVDRCGDEVQRARARWRVTGVVVAADPARTALEFGSVAWGKRVAKRLAGNSAFRSTTTPFDGAIGFSAGPDEVNFRIYRGEIIETARKAVDGPTFTIDASELTWLRLLTGPTNDFFRQTMTGAFKVRGNGFQYVRMIKAVMLIIDEARAEAAEALDA
jgi:putative sterol carrier protein